MRFIEQRQAAKIRQRAYQNGKARRRISKLEMLEGRAMLTANPALTPMHNPALADDVNHDGVVSPLDALLLINDLKLHGPHSAQGASPLAATTSSSSSGVLYLDVNGDNMVSALDALTVVKQLADPATTVMTVHTFATDMAGNPITSPITVGTQFKVETDVQDTRDPVNSTPGVGSAFLNFTYDSSVATVDNPSGGQIPVAGPGFDISGTKPLDLSVANQITDEGAFATGGGPSTPVVQQLFTFTATAVASGTETFTPFFDSLAHHDTSFFNPIADLTSGDILFVGDPLQVVTEPVLSISPGPSINEANVGTTPFVFTVSLSQAPLGPVTVQYATADGSGPNGATVADGDYNATSGTLTFSPAGPLTQLVTVLVNADPTVEAPETFSVVLSNVSDDALLSPNSAATGTILNDSISIGNVNVNNTVTGANAVFTVSLSVAPTAPVTVQYQVVPGTATLGEDYSAPTGGTLGTLTFNPTVTTELLTVPIIGDAFPDVSEQFQVVLSSPTNAILNNGQSTETATGTIAPAVAIPSVSITPLVSLTNVAPLTNFVFTVSLSSPVNSEPLLVAFATADGTSAHPAHAVNGDYNATSGTVTFAPGSTQQFITVQVPGNAASVPNEDFSVNLSPISADVTGSPSGTGLIISQKGTATLTLSGTTVNPGAVGALAVFTVSLNFPVTQVVTVPYATADNTAIKNVDYLPQSGQLTFTPSDASLTQFITVPVLGQTAPTSNESFFLNLTPPTPSNGLIEANSIGVGTIVRQGLTIADASAQPSQNAIFTVSLSQAQDHTVTVAYNTLDGTGAHGAIAGTDYAATSGILTFLAGQTSSLVTVAILPNTAIQPNETFSVALSNPTGGVQILLGQATGTIVNQQGQLASVQLKLTDTNGNLLPANTVLTKGQSFRLAVYVQDTQQIPTGIFQAYVNALYDSNLVQVTSGSSIVYGPTFNNNQTGDITSTPGQVIDAGAFQLSPPANTGAQQLLLSVPLTAKDYGLASFTVGPSSQPLHDIEEFITNGIPVSEVNFVNSADNPLQINIGNNVIAVGNVTQAVGAAGSPPTPFVFPVTRFLPNGTTATVVVTATTDSDDTGGPGLVPAPSTAFTAVTQTLTFSGTGASETQNVTVLVPGNNTVFPPEDFLVELSGATNAQASAAAGVGTIESAFPPKVSITGDSESEGTALVFTVSLNAPSTQQATVQFSTAQSTTGTAALPGVNYTPTSGTLTFQPNTTTQTITVQSLYNISQAVDETFQVVLSNPSASAALDTNSTAVGTVRVIPPAKISGLVYVDLNNNGRPDTGEVGIPNVTVTAVNVSTNVSTSLLTNADGTFNFSNLQPGTYTLREVQPGFFADGIDARNGVVSPYNDQFSNITVASNQTASGFDFGEQGLRAQFAAAFLNRRAYFASSIITGELGSQMNPASTNLQKGDVWISFDNGLQGATLIQALFQASQGSVTMSLYDNNLQLVATSVATSTGAQISLNAMESGAYFLHITGTNPSVSLQVSTAGASATPSAQSAASASFAPALAGVASAMASSASSSAATDAALTQEHDWQLALLLA